MKVGDKVVMTKKDRRVFIGYHSYSGVVTRVGDLSVWVHRDGLKRPERWHKAFWRKIRRPSE
jgi:hypothetical protein